MIKLDLAFYYLWFGIEINVINDTFPEVLVNHYGQLAWDCQIDIFFDVLLGLSSSDVHVYHIYHLT